MSVGKMAFPRSFEKDDAMDASWILDNSDDNFQTAMPKIVVFFGFR